MAGGLRFTKMHGAGNGFVVLDLRDGLPSPDPEQSERKKKKKKTIR